MICHKCGEKLTQKQTYFINDIFLNKHETAYEKGLRPICKLCKKETK